MKNILFGLCVFATVATSSTAQFPVSNAVMYEGPWVVTNRDIDGTMTAVLTNVGTNRWTGHFYGVWQGSSFSYHVDFTGPRDNLRGEAEIDGAQYLWAGIIDRTGTFKGNFNGTRYNGHFALKPK